MWFPTIVAGGRPFGRKKRITCHVCGAFHTFSNQVGPAACSTSHVALNYLVTSSPVEAPPPLLNLHSAAYPRVLRPRIEAACARARRLSHLLTSTRADRDLLLLKDRSSTAKATVLQQGPNFTSMSDYWLDLSLHSAVKANNLAQIIAIAGTNYSWRSSRQASRS